VSFVSCKGAGWAVPTRVSVLTRSDGPTLEDLRNVADAAWLWDGARGRIVWANGAGVAYFGGTSVFDLIDRPFDLAEPGVERIMGYSHSLQRGQTEAALLHFPSSGHMAPLSCQCSIHALADGRAGVLVVAPLEKSSATAISPEKLAHAFDLLPVAAAFVGHDGSLHGINTAAKLMFGSDQRASLSTLIENAALVDDLLTRLATTGTLSEIASVRTKIGQRDFRLTLRKLGNDADAVAFAMLLLDDVTDRRALERSMLNQSKGVDSSPQFAASDAETFRQLGRVLNEFSASPATVTIPAPKTLQRNPAVIPEAVTKVIDGIREPVIIAKGAQVLYANPRAQAFFGHSTLAALINDRAVWDLFAHQDQPLPAKTIKLGDKSELTLSAQMSTIAWLHGPARQFTLREVSPSEPKPEVAETQPIIETVPEPRIEIVVEVAKPPVPGLEDIAPVADDELRAILDTATDGIITLDKSGKIHTFSAGAEAIFGYRIAEVADKPFSDLLAPDSRKVVRDYLAALQGPGLASVFNDGREVNAIVKQGGTVPLFLTIGALQSKTSRSAFCAVVRDITQWKRTEAELRDAKEVAEAMSRQKSEFLARISHELRTPLNAIMGFSEVMRLGRFGEIKNEKYRGYVNDIHSSGGLLLSLINDLLDLSKVEAGQLELNFTSVNLNDTADNAMKMLQEAATGARVVIRKTMPADLPNVVADQRSMRQIMLNVLSNAIKFTDPGGQVIVSAVMNQSGELKFRVKDTGIGMNDDQLRDALEPFKRVVTAGREVQGTGLGLPLTKALAEANRTTFNISSEPRKGTLIELTFPTTRVLAD
jgi:PAS domain S-box-containing protein